MIRRLSVSVFGFLLIFTVGYADVINKNLFFNNANVDRVIFVDKAKRSLHVYDIKEDIPVEVKRFDNILLGEKDGNKQVEGDKKTPEGVYHVTRFIHDDRLAPIYGVGSYPLSYPNFMDKKEGKTGYGIWIHGVDDTKQKDFTQGCVAVQNAEMEELIDLNLVRKTVVISQAAEYDSHEGYLAEKAYWMNYLDKYVKSWQESDYNTFSNMIHDDFRNNKRQKAAAFLNNKKQLMKIFPYKRIEASEVEIYKENGDKNLIVFKQNYCAPNMKISGRKKLYLQKDGEDWKVIGEEFKNLPADFDVSSKVNAFLENWEKSCEQQNIDDYISYYADEFKSKKMNIKEWKMDKIEKFEKTEMVNIGISHIRIHPISPIRYNVSFKQKYTADAYSDFGVKTLTLIGCPGDFKIMSEGWSAIK